MKTNKFRHATHASITVRFTISEYLEIEKVAEENGTNLAEELRGAWRNSQQKVEIKTALQNIESKLTKNMFLVGAAIQGLNESERKEALAEIQTLLRGSLK
jgi:polyhydroxyalkanoate synthesis regulator protein